MLYKIKQHFTLHTYKTNNNNNFIKISLIIINIFTLQQYVYIVHMYICANAR